jgi:hypothetical protein
MVILRVCCRDPQVHSFVWLSSLVIFPQPERPRQRPGIGLIALEAPSMPGCG